MITINDKAMCTGCAACASVCPKSCISMAIDEEGFAYPQVNQTLCVNCNACDKVCPVQNQSSEVPFNQDAYVVQNKDEIVLKESTAGGAFTAIAKCIIRKGGVVFGVAMSDELSAHHIWVDNETELEKFRNSKYVQSFTDGVYKEVKTFLKQGRMVCFSGTPCQVEGLLNYLGKKYENLITVDVVCRAVPSPLVFKKYLEFQNKRLGSQVNKVRFRDKYFGYKYSTMNVYTEKNHGNYHQGVEIDPWLRAFFSGVCIRPSCYQCKFKKRYRVSDFTVWDCFNVGRFSKEMDNDKGATRVLVHTDKGRALFAKALADLKYIKLEPDKIIEGTAEMTKPVHYNNLRSEFMRDAQNLDGVLLFEKYFPETIKVRGEHFIRLLCYRLGIYSVMKKLYVKITHKY